MMAMVMVICALMGALGGWAFWGCWGNKNILELLMYTLVPAFLSAISGFLFLNILNF